MDYFTISKYQTIEENIPYSSMILYNILDKEMHIDELFTEYTRLNNITLNLNVERVLLLCLTFLYSIGKIELTNKYIKRYEL
ncbi:hypothetical protein EAI30_05350 [Romboutsia ilealis]|uniref:Uncharacterized protein n=1 Tax=Romboutsia faecis TaxID=2764597 RepID=A0ABR7JNT0_9FIRM|nr:ABC-three component system middle component 6 [Romboutsia faecis]MBC5996515.1 hypothetical protein [Romboutsia faecis]MRN24041.1 hypothetical protein [Romboutsia ilealis]